MSTVYTQIGSNLYFVRQPIDNHKHAIAAEAVDHVVVVDCSGSMAYDLPKLREYLKNQLTNLLGKNDTLTVIWFSGKGQCGRLLDAEPVATLAELDHVHKLIDRWLVPIGLTGFKGPLHSVLAFAERASKSNRPLALVFMTDGQDNQWPHEEIFSAIDLLRPRLRAATFVEFGPYADRAMLTKMAERAGGRHVVAEDFKRYSEILAEALSSAITDEPRVEIKVGAEPIGGFVYGDFGDWQTYAIDGKRSTMVNATIERVFYATTKRPNGATELPKIETAATYAGIALYALRGEAEIALGLLKLTGDVRLIKQYARSFGKGPTARFAEKAMEAASNPDEFALVNGYNPNLVPDEDAFTIFHLFDLLLADPMTRLCLDHPRFKYSRISRQRVPTDENLSIEEQAKIDEIRAKMGRTRAAKAIKELQAELDAILKPKRDALVFKPEPAPGGYELDGIVFNEDSPNISVRIKRYGWVDLSDRISSAPAAVRKSDADGNLPSVLQTYTYRNYALVSHGQINVDELPVIVSQGVRDRLVEAKVDFEMDDGVTIIKLSDIPVLNRAMLRPIRFEDMARYEFELIRLRAQQKVFKWAVAEHCPRGRSSTLIERFGADAAAWLTAQGITDNGFSPKSTVAPSADYITGRELAISVAGYSTLPPIKALIEKMKKIADGDKKAKLNGPETLMAEALAEIKGFAERLQGQNLKGGWDDELRLWLQERERALIGETRKLIRQMANMKFVITVGQKWFSEFSSLDENSLDVYIPGVGEIKVKADLREIKILV